MGRGPLIDRAAFRAMVEDHCRLYLLLAAQSLEKAEACVRRFEEQVNALAELMPFDEATVFLRYIDLERTLALQAFEADSSAFRSRLGLDGLEDKQSARGSSQIVMLLRAVRRVARRQPYSGVAVGNK